MHPRETILTQPRALNFTQSIREALLAEMRRDPSVILIGEGVHHGAAYSGWVEEFGGGRVLDAPIAEQGFSAAALGAAIMGLRPVAMIGRGDWLYCAGDSIINEIAKYRYVCGGEDFKAPLVIKVSSTGMGVGSGSQHAQSVEATFMHIPGLKIAMPATPSDAAGLMRSAIRDNNPVLFFEHRLLHKMEATEPFPEDPEYQVPFGQAVIRRPGRDVTVVSYAYMLHKSLAAAEILAGEGIEAEVIDLRTLLPWDKETVLASVRRTGRLVTVSEDCKTAGTGAEIAATVAEEAFGALTAPIKRVAYPDTIVPGSYYGEALCMLDEQDVVAAVRGVMGKR